MTIYFATDHAGFALKNELVAYLKEKKIWEVVDCGAEEYDEGDDYTDLIPLAVRKVSADPENAMAIILGGSGQGEAMVANRFPHVRAVVYYGGNKNILVLSREHNNANVLSLGARCISVEEAKEAVDIWLSTEFSKAPRHDRRNTALDNVALDNSAHQ